MNAAAVGPLRRVSPTLWELPKTYNPGMRVTGMIVATSDIAAEMDSAVFDQLADIACLPSIVGHAWCMPDGHPGYGFPIGGVAAFDARDGIISPGGIGFDINCGMRLATTSLTEHEVRPRMASLMDSLFEAIPTGVGGNGLISLSRDEFRQLLVDPMGWCLGRGYATKDDVEMTEDGGCMSGADAGAVSDHALDRGCRQIGSLGSGNHYLEVQAALPEGIAHVENARSFGVDQPGQVLVMLHTGSRGFGHQVATDYLKRFQSLGERKHGIQASSRELAHAPFLSEEGQRYFAAMQCAVNMAFVNRQVILHRVREVFSDVFRRSPEDLGIRQVYDVTHNTARVETHDVCGEQRELIVHRKGATRSLGPGAPGLHEKYAAVGQPVIIGGSMETGSYVLAGRGRSKNAWCTTAHGSGRVMGRREAKRRFQGDDIRRQMLDRSIYVRSRSTASLAEEAGAAYKDIDRVVSAIEQAGLSVPAVRLTPLGNIKG